MPQYNIRENMNLAHDYEISLPAGFNKARFKMAAAATRLFSLVKRLKRGKLTKNQKMSADKQEMF
jgi:hypothetical protein